MTRLYNLTRLKSRRRQLRRQPIPSEAKFWMFLRNHQFHNLKFRRQHSVGGYILDFYCPALRLAIEIDGESHLRPGRDVKDMRRQQWIERQGITIVRFLSTDVISNFAGVIERLEQIITSLTT